MISIVIDTNVFVSALMSRQGASFRLLSLVDTKRFDIALSVPLILEYEDVSKRMIGAEIALSTHDIDDVIDYLCSISLHRQIHYLWRPTVRDPRDDMVLELAVSAGCRFIVTYNIHDFQGTALFGIEAIKPKEFLEYIGALP